MKSIIKSKVNLIIAIGSVGVLMLSFQNCSKYQYAATDMEGFNTSNGAPIDTDNLPDGTYIQISDQVADGTVPSSDAPVSESSPVVNPIAPIAQDEKPPVVNPIAPIAQDEKPPVVNPIAPIAQDEKPPVVNPIAPIAQDEKPPVVNPIAPIAQDEKPPVVNPIAKNEDEDEDDHKKDKNNEDHGSKSKKEHHGEDYAKVCEQQAGKSSRNIAQDSLSGEVSGLSGKLVLNEDNINDIKSIEDFKGRIILCGVDLDKISNTKGSLVLVDSEVKEISEHSGNIKILGESRAEISKSNAEVQIKRRQQ